MKLKGLLAALFLAVLAIPAQAQLWYNGDFNPSSANPNALSSEVNTFVSQSMVYGDFVVGAGGWNITGVFANFLNGTSSSTAAYEIRSGVSEGNGGSLLSSGTVAASVTATGRAGFGIDEYDFLINGLSIYLAPGTYWLGMSVVGGPGDGSTRAFLSNTDGTNGVNSNLDNMSFFNSVTFGTDFANANSQGVFPGFSMGIDGTVGNASVTPEPATMTLLATGLVGMVGTGMKRRRRKA